ncbi:MAG: DUF378 domain-containing protein [Clostridia bacterium]|nr:DUF378 domain-containing protein [Clostridia bacterium]
MKMIIGNIIALVIMIIGCLNWFLVGVFSWNLVTWIFGVGVFTRIIYAIVGLAGLWMLIQLCIRRSRLFSRDETIRRVRDDK